MSYFLDMVSKEKPELWIHYSSIYDKRIHEWKGLKYKDFSREGNKYKEKLQREWKKIERKVFDTISEVSGLEWKKPIIDCYVVQKTIPFSTPLTIPIRKDLEKQMETIIHELIHNILVQNNDRVMYKRYGELSKTTRIHVLVNAIEKEVLLKIYGPKRTKKFIKTYKWPDYKRAWEIVEKEGSKKIIKDCIKLRLSS